MNIKEKIKRKLKKIKKLYSSKKSKTEKNNNFQNCGLFFSGYAEGTSNNKYLEIYNPTDSNISLDGYAYPNVTNGPDNPNEYDYWNTFDPGAVIAAGDVYVIAHGSADPAILSEADEFHTYLSNGDDGYALVQGTEEDYVIIDIIGTWDADPGSGWDVAGVTNGTKDHSLIRKPYITSGNSGNWAVSAGTNADDSEWIVLDQNDWTGLGSHKFTGSCVSVPGCTNSNANNYDSAATVDNGSCTFDNPCNLDGIQVTANSYLFSPSDLTVNVGDLVFWVNNNGFHNVNGEINTQTGVSFGNPESFFFDPVTSVQCIGSHTFTIPGVYNYDCSIGSHANLGMVATITVKGIDGCTNINASNYNPDATYDDGTCIIYGCTSPNASNYNPDANEDDGTCNCSGSAPQDCYSNCILQDIIINDYPKDPNHTRVLTYNIAKNLDERIDSLIQDLNADIILLQEVDTSNLNLKSNEINNSTDGSILKQLSLNDLITDYNIVVGNTQHTEYNQDTAIIYKKNIQYVSSEYIDINDSLSNNNDNGGSRDALQSTFIINEEIIIMNNLHLKCCTDSDDYTERNEQITNLINSTTLNVGNNIIGGDFNIFGSWESAYQQLYHHLQGGDCIELNDPLFIYDSNTILDWNGLDSYGIISHPQYASSIYLNKLQARLDNLMLSQNLHSLYVPNSYTVVNNPQRSCSVIDEISCSDVGFLESISDHLPVYIDINLDDQSSCNYSLDITLIEGWNLISGISTSIDVNQIIDKTGIIIAGTIYGFNGSYFSPNVIEPGNGYWICASEPGTITITNNN